VTSEQLPHLETFAKAAELSNFTAAGQALGLTQAAVSQRIQSLEQVLGVPLFRRQGGHVLLTDAGQRLYEYAQRILGLHREARQAVTGHKAPLAGDLSLAASSIPGEHLLPALLPVFRQKHPHIQIRVKISDTREVLTQVEHGQAQLGLVGGKSHSPHLEFRCFACDKMVLVVPAGHPWRGRKRISLKQLCGQPLILREPGSGSRWCLEHALERAGRGAHDLKVGLELGSNEAIKEAVRRGMGLAVLSTHAVEQELRAGQLYGLQVTGLALVRDMFVVWDRRRVLPIPARLFLDFLDPCPPGQVES
jgi:DNA-binding transcriptional LysR family regulator